jgi:cystathionine beta-lyase
LNNHPKVNTVLSRTASDPFHEIAKKQMRGFEEWFLSISSPVKKKMQLDFLKNKTLFLAESLGGVESANYSVMMAHASIPEDKRKKLESPMI